MESVSSRVSPMATDCRSLSSADGGLAVERLAVPVLSCSQTPTASTMTKWVLLLGVGRDALQVVGLDDAAAAALHLLEVGRPS